VTLLEAVVLGLVQGVFMFVPVSSTSHMVLVQHALIARGSGMPAPESAGMLLFDLVVHVGTLVSVLVVFRESVRRYGGRVMSELRGEHRGDRLALRLAAMAAVAVAVTGVVGFPLRSGLEAVFATPSAIAATLVITGILLLWTDLLPPRPRRLRELNLPVAAVVGLGQGLALLPGLSRSGTTIAFGLFAGLRRRWAAEFSFFIAFPTILGGTLLIAVEVLRSGEPPGIGVGAYAVGFLVAAGVGVLALRLVLLLLYRARLRYFSFYVWTLAVGVLAAAGRGWLG